MAKTATPEQHNAGIHEFSKEPSVLQLILICLATLTTFFVFIYNVSP
jgi:hypothetical protein